MLFSDVGEWDPGIRVDEANEKENEVAREDWESIDASMGFLPDRQRVPP